MQRVPDAAPLLRLSRRWGGLFTSSPAACCARRRYMVAYGEQQSDLLLGFPWVLTDILADIKRTAPMEREEEAAAAAAGDGAAAEATE